jgi:hypothetical protein
MLSGRIHLSELRHFRQATQKPAAGLPTQVMNDKGRYRQLAYGHRSGFPQPPPACRFCGMLSTIEAVWAQEFRSSGFLTLTSFIIYYLGRQAGNKFGSFAQTATIRSLVCSREMRPVAFLDPRAVPVTNLAQLPKRSADSSGLLCHHSSTNREQIAIPPSKLAMDWLRLRVERG